MNISYNIICLSTLTVSLTTIFFSIEVRSRLNSNVTQLSLPVCSSSSPHCFSVEGGGYDWPATKGDPEVFPDGICFNENASNSHNGAYIIDPTIRSTQCESVNEIPVEMGFNSSEIADINISLTVLNETIDAVVKEFGDDDDCSSLCEADSRQDEDHDGSVRSFRSANSIDETIDAIFSDALSESEEACSSIASFSSSQSG